MNSVSINTDSRGCDYSQISRVLVSNCNLLVIIISYIMVVYIHIHLNPIGRRQH